MSKYKGMVRVWGYIPEELDKEIQEMCEKDRRKHSAVVSILIVRALNERKRKKNVKKVHIQD